MSERLDLLFPVGRMVAGSMYDGRSEDAEGRPLVYKSGANQGQPRQDFYFGLAIQKQGEAHWNQTAWGAQIWDFAQKHFPSLNLAQPGIRFAWKIKDGDSTQPNSRGVRDCDREGYPGHWVVYFSSSVPPRLYHMVNGQAQPLNEPNAIKPGYYIEVFGNIASNGSSQQPGIYMNHSMVCLAGYGPEIVIGPDVGSVGFGSAQLPPGASATPPGGLVPPTPAPAAPVQQAPAPAPAPAPQPQAAPPVQQQPVQPAHDFLNPPAPTPAAETSRIVAGQVYTDSQLRAAGWSDEQINSAPLAG